MKKSEILRNEAAVMLAGAFELANGVEEVSGGFWADTADNITKKLLEAAETYIWEQQDE